MSYLHSCLGHFFVLKIRTVKWLIAKFFPPVHQRRGNKQNMIQNNNKHSTNISWKREVSSCMCIHNKINLQPISVNVSQEWTQHCLKNTKIKFCRIWLQTSIKKLVYFVKDAGFVIFVKTFENVSSKHVSFLIMAISKGNPRKKHNAQKSTQY